MVTEYAEVDESGVITRVISAESIKWCKENLGGNWISADSVGPGYFLYEPLGIFIPPKPADWYELGNDGKWHVPKGTNPSTGQAYSDEIEEGLYIAKEAKYTYIDYNFSHQSQKANTLSESEFSINISKGPVQYTPGEKKEIRRIELIHPDAGPSPADDLYFSSVSLDINWNPITAEVFSSSREVELPGANENVVAFMDTFFASNRVLAFISLAVRSDMRGQGLTSRIIDMYLNEWGGIHASEGIVIAWGPLDEAVSHALKNAISKYEDVPMYGEEIDQDRAILTIDSVKNRGKNSKGVLSQ